MSAISIVKADTKLIDLICQLWKSLLLFLRESSLIYQYRNFCSRRFRQNRLSFQVVMKHLNTIESVIFIKYV